MTTPTTPTTPARTARCLHNGPTGDGPPCTIPITETRHGWTHSTPPADDDPHPPKPACPGASDRAGCDEPATPIWCTTHRDVITAAINDLPRLAGAVVDIGEPRPPRWQARHVINATKLVDGATGQHVGWWVALDCHHTQRLTNPPGRDPHPRPLVRDCDQCRAVTPDTAGTTAPTPPAERAATGSNAPAPSPAWHAADAAIMWLIRTEEAVRHRLGQPAADRIQSRDRRRSPGLYADTSTRLAAATRSAQYLAGFASALLCMDASSLDDLDAVTVGRAALTLHRRTELAAGVDDLVHHLGRCPRCQRVALIRHDGRERVECQVCGASWAEDQYRWMVRLAVSARSTV